MGFYWVLLFFGGRSRRRRPSLWLFPAVFRPKNEKKKTQTDGQTDRATKTRPKGGDDERQERGREEVNFFCALFCFFVFFFAFRRRMEISVAVRPPLPPPSVSMA